MAAKNAKKMGVGWAAVLFFGLLGLVSKNVQGRCESIVRKRKGMFLVFFMPKRVVLL
jgi:hypothetical protein